MSQNVSLSYSFLQKFFPVADMDKMYVLFELNGKSELSNRSPINLSVVLDRSGSMSGEPLHYCKEATKFIVNQLQEKDLLNVVVFDDHVKTGSSGDGSAASILDEERIVMMSLKYNEKGLYILDEYTMTAIFDCVYGMHDFLEPKTKQLLKDKQFKDFIHLLLTIREYNYRYRYCETVNLFPVFEVTVGPMETNSEGTAFWLALGLAIKEIYGLRRETLKELLGLVKIRK